MSAGASAKDYDAIAKVGAMSLLQAAPLLTE